MMKKNLPKQRLRVFLGGIRARTTVKELQKFLRSIYPSLGRVEIPIKEDISSKSDIKYEVIHKNIEKVPMDHKEAMLNDPTLYYLFFYLLLQNEVVKPETKITSDYNVADALMYLTENVWDLDLKIVTEGLENEFEVELDLRTWDHSEYSI